MSKENGMNEKFALDMIDDSNPRLDFWKKYGPNYVKSIVHLHKNEDINARVAASVRGTRLMENWTKDGAVAGNVTVGPLTAAEIVECLNFINGGVVPEGKTKEEFTTIVSALNSASFRTPEGVKSPFIPVEECEIEEFDDEFLMSAAAESVEKGEDKARMLEGKIEKHYHLPNHVLASKMDKACTLPESIKVLE